MSPPAFSPLPPAHLRRQIPLAEWEALLDSWSYLTQSYLSVDLRTFSALACNEKNQLSNFLGSVFTQVDENTVSARSKPKEMRLQRLCFLVIKRLVENQITLPVLSDSLFLGMLCARFAGSRSLRELLRKLWKTHNLDTSPTMGRRKSLLINDLNRILGSPSQQLENEFHQTAALIKASPDYGLFLMQGSDFLDSLVAAWDRASQALRKKIILMTYHVLLSLLQGQRSNVSLLVDNLYSLRTDYERKTSRQQASILSDLVCSTNLLRKFRENNAFSTNGRCKSISQSFDTIRSRDMPTAKRIQPSIGKGKRRVVVSKESHAQMLDRVKGIRDIFPDIGKEKVIRLLAELDGDTERVVARLLNNPPVRLIEEGAGL